MPRLTVNANVVATNGIDIYPVNTADLWSIQTVMIYLCFNRPAVERLIKRGVLTTIVIDGRRYFRSSDIAAFINEDCLLVRKATERMASLGLRRED